MTQQPTDDSPGASSASGQHTGQAQGGKAGRANLPIETPAQRQARLAGKPIPQSGPGGIGPGPGAPAPKPVKQ